MKFPVLFVVVFKWGILALICRLTGLKWGEVMINRILRLCRNGHSMRLEIFCKGCVIIDIFGFF
jgi:hypothetical protein